MLATSNDRLSVSGNSFLDSLPAASHARIFPLLTLEKLSKGHVLSEPNAPFQRVAFPIRSVVSTVALTLEGSAVEVGLTGHDGLAPLPVAFGSLVSPHGTVVQVADSAYCMTAAAFITIFDDDAGLRDRCRRYAEYSFSAATQFVACNGVHPVEERYARWILMASDRVGMAEIDLTQEYSAQMLGVRRATVTNIALSLSRSGAISYRRGRITVTDRKALQDSACECYAAVNSHLQRLMGYGARQAGDIHELTR